MSDNDIPDYVKGVTPDGIHTPIPQSDQWENLSQDQISGLRHRLIDSIVQVIVQAVAGVFIPGGLPGDSIKQLQDWANGIVDGIGGAVGQIQALLTAAGQLSVSALGGAIAGAVNAFADILSGFGLGSVANWITDLLGTKTAANNALTNATEALGHLSDMLTAAAQSTFTGIGDALKGVVNNFTSILTGFGLGSVANWITDLLGTKTTAGNAQTDATQALGHLSDMLTGAAQATFTNFGNALKGTVNNFASILTGFGLGSVANWITDLLGTKSTASTASTNATTALGNLSAMLTNAAQSTFANVGLAVKGAVDNFNAIIAPTGFNLPDIGSWITSLLGTKSTASTASTNATNALGSISQMLTGAVVGSATALGNALAGAVSNIQSTWDNLWAGLTGGTTTGQTAATVKTAAGGVKTTSDTASTNATSALGSISQMLTGAVVGSATALGAALAGAVTNIQSTWDNLWAGLTGGTTTGQTATTVKTAAGAVKTTSDTAATNATTANAGVALGNQKTRGRGVAGSNLVIDPGFESTALDAQRTLVGTIPSQTYDSTRKRSGSRSVKFIQPATVVNSAIYALPHLEGTNPITDAIVVQPGQVFQASCWAWADTANTGTVQQVANVIRFDDSTGALATTYVTMGSVNLVVSKGAWVQVTGKGTAPAGYDRMLPLMASARTGGAVAGDTFWFDDMEVYEVTAPQTLLDSIFQAIFGGTSVLNTNTSVKTQVGSVKTTSDTASTNATSALGSISQMLTGAAVGTATALGNALSGAVSNIQATLDNLWQGLTGNTSGAGTTATVKTAAGSVKTTSDTASTNATTALGNFTTMLSNAGQATVAAMGAALATAGTNIQNTWDQLWQGLTGNSSGTGKTTADIKTASGAVKTTSDTASTNATNAIGSISQMLTGAAVGTATALGNALSGAVSNIQSTLDNLWQGLTGNSSGVGTTATVKTAATGVKVQSDLGVTNAATADGKAVVAKSMASTLAKRGDNLAGNPSFELTNLAGNSSLSTDQARTGVRSLKLVSNGSTDLNWTFVIADEAGVLEVAVQPLDVFYFEVWVYGKSTNVQTTGSANGITMAARFSDRAGTPLTYASIALATTTALNGVWTKVSGYVQAPANAATVMIYLILRSTVPVGETYYLDDVVVQRYTDTQVAINAMWEGLTGGTAGTLKTPADAKTGAAGVKTVGDLATTNVTTLFGNFTTLLSNAGQSTVAAVGAALSGAVSNIQATLDNLWQGLTGNSSGAGTTATVKTAAGSVKTTSDSASTNATSALGSISQMLTGAAVGTATALGNALSGAVSNIQSTLDNLWQGLTGNSSGAGSTSTVKTAASAVKVQSDLGVTNAATADGKATTAGTNATTALTNWTNALSSAGAATASALGAALSGAVGNIQSTWDNLWQGLTGNSTGAGSLSTIKSASGAIKTTADGASTNATSALGSISQMITGAAVGTATALGAALAGAVTNIQATLDNVWQGLTGNSSGSGSLSTVKAAGAAVKVQSDLGVTNAATANAGVTVARSLLKGGAVAGSNLTLDPSFDNAALDTLRATMLVGGGVWSYDTTATRVRSGGRSLKSVFPGGTVYPAFYAMPQFEDSTINGAIPVQPGQTFYMSFWVWADTANTGTGPVSGYLDCQDSKGVNTRTYPTFGSLTLTGAQKGQWVQCAGMATVPAGYDRVLFGACRMSPGNAAGDTFWFDDVEVAEVTRPQNLLDSIYQAIFGGTSVFNTTSGVKTQVGSVKTTSDTAATNASTALGSISQMLTGAVVGSATALGTALSGAVSNIQSTLDNLWQGLTGNASGAGTTATVKTAAGAVKSTSDTASTNATTANAGVTTVKNNLITRGKAGPNLASDPDMSNAAMWTQFVNCSGALATTRFVSAPNALRITTTIAGPGTYLTIPMLRTPDGADGGRIAVRAGQTFEVSTSVFVETANTTTAAGYVQGVLYDSTGVNANTNFAGNQVATKGAWAKSTVKIQVPVGYDQMVVWMVVLNTTVAGDVVWFDENDIRETTAAQTLLDSIFQAIFGGTSVFNTNASVKTQVSGVKSTSDTAATNATTALGNFTTLLTNAGQATVAAVGTALSGAVANIQSTLDNLWQGLTGNSSGAGTAATVKTAAGSVKTTSDTASTNATTALGNFTTMLSNAGQATVAAMGAALATAGTNIQNTWDQLWQGLTGNSSGTGSPATIKSASGAIKTTSDSASTNATSALGSISQMLTAAAVGTATALGTALSGAVSNIQSTWDNIWQGLTGNSSGTGTLSTVKTAATGVKVQSDLGVTNAATADGKAVSAGTKIDRTRYDSENLVAGSDFENSAIQPWGLNANRTLDTTQAHSGSASLKFSGTSGGSSYSGGAISMNEGDYLYAEAWVMRDASFNATDCRLRLGANTAAVPGGVNMANLTFPPSSMATANTWYLRSAVLGPYPAGTISTLPSLQNDMTAGTLWIDDIVVRRVKPAEVVGALPQSKTTGLVADLTTAATNASTALGNFTTLLSNAGQSTVAAVGAALSGAVSNIQATLDNVWQGLTGNSSGAGSLSTVKTAGTAVKVRADLGVTNAATADGKAVTADGKAVQVRSQLTANIKGGNNLATNPSFEDTTLAYMGSATFSTEQARSGIRSAKMLGAAASRAFELTSDPTSRLPISCVAGQTFYMEAWVYGHASNVQTTGGALGISILGVMMNAAGTEISFPIAASLTSSTALNGVWTKMAGTLTIPATAGIVAWVPRIWILSQVPVGEAYYFDDVVIRETTEALIADTKAAAAQLSISQMLTGAAAATATALGTALAGAVSGVQSTLDNLWQGLTGLSGTGQTTATVKTAASGVKVNADLGITNAGIADGKAGAAQTSISQMITGAAVGTATALGTALSGAVSNIQSTLDNVWQGLTGLTGTGQTTTTVKTAASAVKVRADLGVSNAGIADGKAIAAQSDATLARSEPIISTRIPTVAAASIADSVQNLILNPTFNDSNALSGSTAYAWDGTVSHTTGGGSAKSLGFGKYLLSNRIETPYNTRLAISAWTTASGVTATAAQNAIRISLAKYDVDGARLSTLFLDGVLSPAGTVAWDQLSFAWLNDDPAVAFVRLELGVTTAMTAGTVWFDDIAAVKTNTLAEAVGEINDLTETAHNTKSNVEDTWTQLWGGLGAQLPDDTKSLGETANAAAALAGVAANGQDLAVWTNAIISLRDKQPLWNGPYTTSVSNFPLSEMLNGTGDPPFVVASTANGPVAFWKATQTARISLIEFYGRIVGSASSCVVYIYRANYANGTWNNGTALTTSANIAGAMSTAWSLVQATLAAPVDVVEGEVYAIQFVTAGTVNVAGKNGTWLPSHPTQHPKRMGAVVAPSAQALPSMAATTYTGDIPWVSLAIVTGDVPPPYNAPRYVSISTDGAYAWALPSWVNFIDCIYLGAGGGGAGGDGALGQSGTGGNAGTWATETLQRGVDFPTGFAGNITGVVGAGGAAPPTKETPGGAGGNTTRAAIASGKALATAAGGAGGTGYNAHDGLSPGNIVYGGMSLQGGVLTPNAGGGGAGGNGAAPGGGAGGGSGGIYGVAWVGGIGGRGGAWFRLRQS